MDAIGTTMIDVDGREVDLKPPWRRATMAELIEENAGVKMHPSMPIAEAREIADALRRRRGSTSGAPGRS